MHVDGDLHRQHVASNQNVTCYTIHPARSPAAMRAMGMLPGFVGYAVRDHRGPYTGFDEVLHVLCDTHLIRDFAYDFDRPFDNDLTKRDVRRIRRSCASS